MLKLVHMIVALKRVSKLCMLVHDAFPIQTKRTSHIYLHTPRLCVKFIQRVYSGTKFLS